MDLTSQMTEVSTPRLGNWAVKIPRRIPDDRGTSDVRIGTPLGQWVSPAAGQSPEEHPEQATGMKLAIRRANCDGCEGLRLEFV
jgi:hypothetical protein